MERYLLAKEFQRWSREAGAIALESVCNRNGVHAFPRCWRSQKMSFFGSASGVRLEAGARSVADFKVTINGEDGVGSSLGGRLNLARKKILPPGARDFLISRFIASGEIFIVYRGMFSHVVIFWTDPSKPDAPNELVAAAKKYVAPIPGIVNFHVGKMVTSHRDVVDQTYQVAMNIQFQSKQAQDEYQDHPQHVEFVKQCKPLSAKLIIYDFE